MGEQDDLVRWAKENGVLCKGVCPTSIPGRGVGMVARRHLKVRSIFKTIENVWI